jgi:hypothetical protein
MSIPFCIGLVRRCISHWSSCLFSGRTCYTHIHTTNSHIIVLLNTLQINRNYIRIEFTQLCRTLFMEMLIQAGVQIYCRCVNYTDLWSVLVDYPVGFRLELATRFRWTVLYAQVSEKGKPSKCLYTNYTSTMDTNYTSHIHIKYYQ